MDKTRLDVANKAHKPTKKVCVKEKYILCSSIVWMWRLMEVLRLHAIENPRIKEGLSPQMVFC